MYIPCEGSSWTLLYQNRKLSSRLSLQNRQFCLCRLQAVNSRWVEGWVGACVRACVCGGSGRAYTCGVRFHTHIYHKVILLIIIFGTHFIMVSNRTDVPKKDSLLALLCACELLLKESSTQPIEHKKYHDMTLESSLIFKI